jgi:hypothetical protein
LKICRKVAGRCNWRDHFEVAINYPKVADPGLVQFVVNNGTEIAGVLELVDLAPPTLAPRGYTAFGNPYTGHGLISNLGETYNNLGVPGALCGEASHRHRWC